MQNIHANLLYDVIERKFEGSHDDVKLNRWGEYKG